MKKMDFIMEKCILPQYDWLENNGYSEKELAYFKELVKNNAHLIIEFLRKVDFLMPQIFS